MKILALVGSPRKGGNTDILVDQILKGAKTKGHTSEKLYLYSIKYPPALIAVNAKKANMFAPLKMGCKRFIQRLGCGFNYFRYTELLEWSHRTDEAPF